MRFVGWLYVPPTLEAQVKVVGVVLPDPKRLLVGEGGTAIALRTEVKSSSPQTGIEPATLRLTAARSAD